MQIYIPKIKFKGSPLIWEYSAKKDSAYCLFQCTNRKNVYSKKEILDYLQGIEGIQIQNNEAVITNARVFFKHYPMVVIAEAPKVLNQINNLELRQTIEINLSPRRRDTNPSSPHLVNVGMFSKGNPGLCLNVLINEDEYPVLYRKTLYFEKLLEKSQVQSTIPNYPIKTIIDVIRHTQFISSNKLYQHKNNQVEVIRKFFDGFLGPASIKIPGTHSQSPLADYFRKVIENILDQTLFHETPFKFINSKDVEKKCKNKPDLFLGMEQGLRYAQATTLVWPLYFFISKDVQGKDLTDDPEIAQGLEQLKKLLKDKKEDMKILFDLLSFHTAKAGEEAYYFQQNRLKLQHQNLNKIEKTLNTYSCNFLLFSLLIDNKFSKGKADKLAEETMQHLIDLLTDLIKNVSIEELGEMGKQLKEKNITDFFLCKEYRNKLKDDLNDFIKDDFSKKEKQEQSLLLANHMFPLFLEELKNRLLAKQNSASLSPHSSLEENPVQSPRNNF